MPPILTAIPEVDACYKIAQYMLDFYNTEIEKVDKELHFDTASEEGLARLEKMYGIKANVTDTLAERRFRIETYVETLAVLNYDTLVRTVKRIAGEDSAVKRNLAEWSIEIKLPLTSEKMKDEVIKMVRAIVPVTMWNNINLKVLYNDWKTFKGEKWSAHAEETFSELKRKVGE